ncbi:MarR family winged helix-turn-helix transcriptional regulator [Microbacterium sp.]|uniref:MarR family winged helix-turn-helix transcriptional regulator n=1 Tax=Microbacterium sp. TaxID=51671 RepID=UPI002CD28F7B|nr:MarR family transcriptional regulator [Microbacterium sp.]HWK76928.1 MarR family transcriptional regulator [Microbacterium sp.]
MTTVPGWTDSLPYTLFRANQAVHRRVLEAIDGVGVSMTQLGIAVHIEKLGRLSGSDLARHFKITPQSVSTALANLEKLGWVQRVPHPVHKRVIWYEITPVGVTGVHEGRSRLEAFHAELAETLGQELVNRATAVLGEISMELEGPDTPPGTLWPAVI